MQLQRMGSGKNLFDTHCYISLYQYDLLSITLLFKLCYFCFVFCVVLLNLLLFIYLLLNLFIVIYFTLIYLFSHFSLKLLLCHIFAYFLILELPIFFSNLIFPLADSAGRLVDGVLPRSCFCRSARNWSRGSSPSYLVVILI